MAGENIYCTVLDVCLVKDDERLYLIRVNSEFSYKGILYRVGDVLDLRSPENAQRCSGLVVKKSSSHEEYYLPGYIKGNFTKANSSARNQGRVPLTNTRPVPQPPGSQVPTPQPMSRIPGGGKYFMTVGSEGAFMKPFLDRNHNYQHGPPPTPPQIEDNTFLTTSPLFPKEQRPKLNRRESLENDVQSFLKQIGCFDELMNKKFKYLESRCKESQLLEDFRGNEVCGRTIYHYIYMGWRPVLHPPQNWKQKAPRSFSVPELYLYMLGKQQRVLGCYLKTLCVDGSLMYYILQDDVLLRQVLPDRSSISESELILFRDDFIFKIPPKT